MKIIFLYNFHFQYAILLTIVVHIFVKYLLHSVDLRSENPWENKAVYLLYTELVLGKTNAVLIQYTEHDIYKQTLK